MPGEPTDPIERIIPPEQPPMDDAAGGPQAEDPNAPLNDEVPTEGGLALEESEAHPS